MSSFNEGDIARDARGKFAPNSTGATTIDLDESGVSAFINRWCSNLGEGLRSGLTSDIKRCSSDAALRMYMDSVNHENFIDPDDANTMVGQGYGTYRQVRDAAARGLDPQFVDAQRFAVIDRLPANVTMADLHPWAQEALLQGNVSVLGDAMSLPYGDDSVDAMVRAHDPLRADMMARAQRIGLNAETYLLECSSVADVDRMRNLRDQSPKTSWRDMGQILRNGHNAGDLQQYGVKLARDFTSYDLSMKVTPNPVMRSLYSSDNTLSLAQISALDRAGVSDGKTLRGVQRCLADPSPGSVATAVGKVTPKTLMAFSAMGEDGLSGDDVDAIAALSDRGYGNPQALAPLVEGLHRQSLVAEGLVGQRQSPLATYADWTRAELQPREITLMSRAGIIPSQMAACVDDLDYWATGAQYRQRYNQWAATYHQEPWKLKEADYQDL